MDYRVFASEADKKLHVVKVLRDIISDELINRGYESGATDAKSNLNNWKKNSVAATNDQKDAQANIVKGKQQLVNLNKRVSKVTMDYRVFASEADKKLHVVKVLRDIISDELINRGPSSLVQLNKFQAKLSELKELLNNNSDSLYTPIISVLLDLSTEQNFADQGVLRKILQNLNNLDKALRDFRVKQEKSLDDEMKSLRKQIKNTRQRVRAYRRMRAHAVSKRIDAQHYINFYTHEITHFNSEKKRKSAELRLFTKLCDFQRRVHKEASIACTKYKAVFRGLMARIQGLRK